MTITDVKVTLVPAGTSLRASASVTLDRAFAIRDLKVVEGSKGLFVSMPSRKTKEGRYLEVVFPVTREMREQLHASVLGAYQKAAAGSH